MQAIIVFKNAEDARRACEKDRDFFSPKFGSRFVRVMAVEDMSQEELTHVDTAFTSQAVKRPATSILSEGSSETTAVRVEGLPANITIPEVVQLFWGTSASPAGTVVQKDPQKPHAHAYMKFGAPEHAMRAVLTWNGTVMTTQSGMFTLSVQPASHHEWDVAAAAGSSKAALLGDAVIKVRGLPVRASTADVAVFFEGYKTKAGGVHIQPFSENRHSKIAYVEFETCEEANRALVSIKILFNTMISFILFPLCALPLFQIVPNNSFLCLFLCFRKKTANSLENLLESDIASSNASPSKKWLQILLGSLPSKLPLPPRALPTVPHRA